MVIQKYSVMDLDSQVASLPASAKVLAERIFHICSTEGELRPPPKMNEWIMQQFGTLEGVLKQKMVKVFNRITHEGAIYNALRAKRPLESRERLRVEAQIIDASISDPLDKPLEDTPEDIFGRIKGKYCITASNIAKFDGLHGIIIFEGRNPLRFNKERIVDYIDTGLAWAEKARQVDPEAKYLLFIWNCLRRAGASLLHGHAQVCLGRHLHYSRVEGLREDAEKYYKDYGTNYFEDLFKVHESLHCGIEINGIKVMAHLTPVKEKEIFFFSSRLDLPLKEMVYEVLACLRDRMQVSAFNLALIMPPLAKTSESWDGFPVIGRVVDRGDPRSGSCDIGSMELFACNVISSDPLQVAEILGKYLLEPHKEDEELGM